MVLTVGQMKIDGRGRVRRVDNGSGHYLATPAETAQFPAVLRSLGVDLAGATLQIYEMSASGFLQTTRQVLE